MYILKEKQHTNKKTKEGVSMEEAQALPGSCSGAGSHCRADLLFRRCKKGQGYERGHTGKEDRK